jgi:hypothetical protein
VAPIGRLWPPLSKCQDFQALVKGGHWPPLAAFQDFKRFARLTSSDVPRGTVPFCAAALVRIHCSRCAKIHTPYDVPFETVTPHSDATTPAMTNPAGNDGSLRALGQWLPNGTPPTDTPEDFRTAVGDLRKPVVVV